MSAKLLAVGHSYILGVNRTVLRALARSYGFSVTVAAPEFYYGDYGLIQLEAEPRDSPLRLAALPTRWTRHPHLYHFRNGALPRLLRAGEFDIVNVWEEPYVFAGWQAAQAVKRYSQASLSMYSCQNLSKRYPPPFSWLERQLVQLTDGWQASGELVKNVLVSRGYAPGRVEVLSLAVDTSLFYPQAPEERRRTLGELGLEPPVIGFVGRLTPPGGKFGGGYDELQAKSFLTFLKPAQTLECLRMDSHLASSRQAVLRALGGRALDLLFIDGDHTYAGVKEDYEMYSPLVRSGGLIAFHDIRENPAIPDSEVQTFWNEVKQGRRHVEFIDQAVASETGMGVGVLWH